LISASSPCTPADGEFVVGAGGEEQAAWLPTNTGGIYLPVLLGSFVLMVPAIMLGKARRIEAVCRLWRLNAVASALGARHRPLLASCGRCSFISSPSSARG